MGIMSMLQNSKNNNNETSGTVSDGDEVFAGMSASKRRKMRQKMKKLKELEESRYSLRKLSDSRENYPDHFFVAANDSDKKESDQGRQDEERKKQDAHIAESKNRIPRLAPALSPRLFTMQRGGFTSYRRSLPCVEILQNEKIGNLDQDQDPDVVDRTEEEEEQDDNHHDPSLHQLVPLRNKEFLPWASNKHVRARKDIYSLDGNRCSTVTNDMLFSKFVMNSCKEEDEDEEKMRMSKMHNDLKSERR